MELYLSGTKGLAALHACLSYPQTISSVRILPDPGVLNDPYELMLQLVQKHRLNLLNRDMPINDSEALAVGWKYLIEAPYERIFVIHDSLLPKYRGWNPLVTALQNKDSEIGVTLLQADRKMDHGPIVIQAKVTASYPLRIADAMTAIENEIKGLVTFLLQIPDRANLSLQNQIEELATYSVWRNEEDYRIDWAKSADVILAFIDSVSYPYKGALTTLNGEFLRIFSAKSVPDLLIVNRTPGKVWRIENGNPMVMCGSGMLEVLDFTFENQPSDLAHLTSTKSKFV